MMNVIISHKKPILIKKYLGPKNNYIMSSNAEIILTMI